ncbi:MAG: hypothetical protein GY830_00920 [Bacteroidetes bacterium]|nr:hypothetical protein [Bacteroidota bacterium]
MINTQKDFESEFKYKIDRRYLFLLSLENNNFINKKVNFNLLFQKEQDFINGYIRDFKNYIPKDLTIIILNYLDINNSVTLELMYVFYNRPHNCWFEGNDFKVEETDCETLLGKTLSNNPQVYFKTIMNSKAIKIDELQNIENGKNKLNKYLLFKGIKASFLEKNEIKLYNKKCKVFAKLTINDRSILFEPYKCRESITFNFLSI